MIKSENHPLIGLPALKTGFVFNEKMEFVCETFKYEENLSKKNAKIMKKIDFYPTIPEHYAKNKECNLIF
jgi:hypothetical protein